MKKRRRLKKWVKTTIEIISMFTISLILVFGLMIGMTEAHYQRLDFYQGLVSASR